MWKKVTITVVAIVFHLLISVITTITINNFYSSDDSYDRMVWRQSIEKQIQEDHDEFKEKLIDRYSRIERNQTSYQYQTNNRLKALEGQVKSLQNQISNRNPVNITNQNSLSLQQQRAVDK